MSLFKWADRLLGGVPNEETVTLYCPMSDHRDDPARIATEEDEPDEWYPEAGVAVYECDYCGSRHRFLWGPPTPLYLGDKREDATRGGPDTYRPRRATGEANDTGRHADSSGERDRDRDRERGRERDRDRNRNRERDRAAEPDDPRGAGL